MRARVSTTERWQWTPMARTTHYVMQLRIDLVNTAAQLNEQSFTQANRK